MFLKTFKKFSQIQKINRTYTHYVVYIHTYILYILYICKKYETNNHSYIDEKFCLNLLKNYYAYSTVLLILNLLILFIP